jgi:molybdopterin/thiamine biosynthesis adenylyltransferase/rhodanese-related sulfurtransferase
MLSPAELARYDRQLRLPEIGIAGQERLRHARVLVVGAGGLGSPAALYLAAAGVGTIGIVDSDDVEPSNLQRQLLHGAADVGRPKTESAAAAIGRLNPDVVVEPHRVRLDTENARGIIARYDLVVDGSDNYATRYVVNDACAALRTPWVYGSVERFSGQVAVFGAGESPCYRCVFPEPPGPGTTASCDEIGVLGAVPGVIGALQATEALKLLAGIGVAGGRLLQMDLLRGETRWVAFGKRADCPACGAREHGDRMTEPAEQELPLPSIEPADVSARVGAGARLLDVREPWELKRASIAGAVSVPMSVLESQVGTLDRSAELIVFCHHGTRSRMVTDWLRAQGYRATNLTGGIDRWSRDVDPAIPRY